MEPNNKKERLLKYKESLKSAWGYNDYNDWPIKVNSVMHLFMSEFSKECVEDIKEIKARNIGFEELAKAFENPARVFRIINPVIYGMKQLRIKLQEQQEVVNFMLDIVKAMKNGSEFNEDGRNIILSDKEVSEVIKNNLFVEADIESARLIQKFCGLMWAYTESIFFRAHDVTKEIHGLYEVGNDRRLIIREYLKLKPNYIWPSVPFIDYEDIKIFSVYNNDLNLRIDSYNHLFLEGGNYVSDMREYFILADNKPIDVRELGNLIGKIPNTIGEIHKWVQLQDWKEIAYKYAQIYWFRKSPFRKVLGKVPEVPDVVKYNIDNGEPDSRRLKNLTNEEIDRLIQIVI